MSSHGGDGAESHASEDLPSSPSKSQKTSSSKKSASTVSPSKIMGVVVDVQAKAVEAYRRKLMGLGADAQAAQAAPPAAAPTGPTSAPPPEPAPSLPKPSNPPSPHHTEQEHGEKAATVLDPLEGATTAPEKKPKSADRAKTPRSKTPKADPAKTDPSDMSPAESSPKPDKSTKEMLSVSPVDPKTSQFSSQSDRRDDGDDESADKFEFNTDEKDEEARRRRLGSRGVGKKEKSDLAKYTESPTGLDTHFGQGALSQDLSERDISTVTTTNVQDSTPQQYYGNDQDYIDEEEDEEEEEMVVLDPEHPLMVRMQGALTKYLTKQLDKLELELKEKTQQQKGITAQREELGVNLYGIQQQLAKQQMLLEQEHDTHASARQQRVQVEELAKQIEQLYNATVSDCKLHQEKDGNLRDKVEALDSTLFYLSQLETNLHNDINITKRAANKALEDITTAEDSKYKQDLYVDRLVEQVDRLTQEIAMYEAQDHAQSDETNSMQALLSEASMELEAVLLEKKKLLQQWQTSLIGMQRRDEAKAAMNQAVELQRETIQALETELNGYKKSITKEQQQNEQLTMLHNKLQMDMATIKRHIQTSLQKREAIKTEYTKYTKILQESELALSKATTDRNIKMNNVNALRQQIEKESRENRKVQEQIYEVHQKGLTMDKSAQYSEKNATRRRKQAQELEAEVANVENDISMKMLEISNAVTAIKGLDEELKNIDVEIREKNDLISHCESEAVKKNAIIERKQGQIDQFNKKIDQLTQKDGGEEVGPLEVQVVTLQKQIKDTEQEKQQLEQYWLRTQSHLVTLSSQAENQWGDVNKMKKQHTILQQKKMRIDTELATTSREIKDQEGSIRQLQNDMTKLNLLITKKTGEQQDKQQDTILMENDFLETLKEAEKNSIEMQNQVDSLTEEKERLLSSLVDSERQIMLWEKKIQLAKETRNTVDTEYGQGELKAMKCEIHRMQVRYNQLMKQQELLIQEMEKAVYRREAITVRGEAQGKLSKKIQTKGTLKKKVEELRKKVKGLAQEAANCDGEINKLQEHQSALAQTLEDKNNNCKELRQTADSLSSQQERLALEKDKAMQDLLSKQKKIKYLDMVKNKKYKMMCKSEDGIEKVRARETERLQSLVNIVDHMNREYPHLRPALHKSTLLLTWRAVPEHV